MPTDWKAAYAAALAERDPAKLPELCEKARDALNSQLLKTRSSAHPRDREELEEALRQVTIHLFSGTEAASPAKTNTPARTCSARNARQASSKAPSGGQPRTPTRDREQPSRLRNNTYREPDSSHCSRQPVQHARREQPIQGHQQEPKPSNAPRITQDARAPTVSKKHGHRALFEVE